ncbi:MAG: hypothetical protein ACK526_16980 [Planctomyces sp.]
MGEYAPFHVQLQELLRRRFWTPRHLFEAIAESDRTGKSDSVQIDSADLEKNLGAVLSGQMAPTRQLGKLIADVVFSGGKLSASDEKQRRDELVGAAFVAEQHGQRFQPPYSLGVFGISNRLKGGRSSAQQEDRIRRIQQERKLRLLRRLVELEQVQRRKTAAPVVPPRNTKKAPDRNLRERETLKRLRELRVAAQPVTTLPEWKDAALRSIAFIPDHARRDDRAAEESFVHVVERCYTAGMRFSQFLNELLTAWKAETPSKRGRYQERMSPEQLGALVGERNRARYGGDAAKKRWFQNHKGSGITGNSLRNYLSGHTVRPQRECVQKLIWAFVADGPIQSDVEQRIWRMAYDPFLIHPLEPSELIAIVNSDWSQPSVRHQWSEIHSSIRHYLINAGIIRVRAGESSVTYAALADRDGTLLTPLVSSSGGRIIPDIVRVVVDRESMYSAIESALESGSRSHLMKTLIEQSGFPVTRVSELTQVHESLFQQWMRESTSQRIEDYQRAVRIVDLLNPPELARWPLTPDRIRRQNLQAVEVLHSNVRSLSEAMKSVEEETGPEILNGKPEALRTWKAALLLRRVFGRGSVTGISGPSIGRMLQSEGIGDHQSFRHLREGVRDSGKKSARRATMDQACFLADVVEATRGPLDALQRKQFIDCVACVSPDAPEREESPLELLMQALDQNSPVTVHSMTHRIMRSQGGLIRFSAITRVSPQSVRAFVTDEHHRLHHSVARRIAERGMGFPAKSDEHRQFVILSTAAWKNGGGRIQVRLSEIVRDLVLTLESPRLETTADSDNRSASRKHERNLRAIAMGRLLSQAAMAPAELATALKVTLPVIAGWTTPRIGRFTHRRPMELFIRLMDYQLEQAECVREFFGPRD